MVVLGGGGVLMSEVPLYPAESLLRGGEVGALGSERDSRAPLAARVFFFITLKPRVE